MTDVRTFIGCVLALLAAPAVVAQEPVIRVTTRLVEVSAVVHDRQGRPVRDLKLGDFEIIDNGKKQNIGLFRLEQTHAESTDEALPEGEVSNRGGNRQAMPGSYSVVLFDSLNTRLADQSYARQQVLAFLREVKPEDRIAVCRMDGARLIILQDFTNRADRLVEAFERLMPEYHPKLAASEKDQALLDEAQRIEREGADDRTGTAEFMAQALRDAAYAQSAFYTKDRVINSCTTMKALASRLAGFPGRKSIIWISGGFPISSVFGEGDENFIRNSTGAKFGELHASRIEDASRVLNDANVAVYPVDVVGLATSAFRNRNINSMTYLAGLTGGVAYYNTNGIRESIRKALDDSAATYTLGYYLDNNDADKRYHSIQVKVRRPGVEVRSKRGYYFRALEPLDADRTEAVSREALWNPFDATAIGLRGRLDEVKPGAVRITLSVTAQDLVFTQRDGKFNADVDFFFAPLTTGKDSPPAERQPVHLSLAQERYREMLRTDWLIGRTLTLGPTVRSVRVLVVDRTTGSAGSITLPVTSPPSK